MASAIRMCAWCRIVLGTAIGDFDGTCPVTHGICAPCADAVTAGRDVRPLLDSLDLPVLAVAADRTVIGANPRARRLLDLPARPGLTAGDAIGCVNALTHEGCGNTPDCVRCGIKASVEATAAGAGPIRSMTVKRRVMKKQVIEDVALQFSTERVGRAVLVGVERFGAA